MSEDQRQEQEAIQNAIEQHMDAMSPADVEKLDPAKKEKLFSIKQLSAEQLGDLLMDATVGAFRRPSMLQRLDECANILIDRLGLDDVKGIELRTEGGMATTWSISAGKRVNFFYAVAVRRDDGRYDAHASMLDSDGVVRWRRNERVPFADPVSYVGQVLEAVGASTEGLPE